MKSNNKFYLPLYYFFGTRISSLFKLISWIFIYIIPTFFIFVSLFGSTTFNSISIYILQLLIIYTFYEVGYIENDAETTKKEKNPTRRLNDLEQGYYEKNKPFIYTVRLLLGFILLFLLGRITQFSTPYFAFLASSITILVIYFFYNRIRSNITLVLHFFLVSIRYLSFALIACSTWKSNLFLILSLFLLYPIVNLLERASSPKFGITILGAITFSEVNLSIFRAAYYFLILAIFVFVVGLQQIKSNWIVWLFAYYFVYRLVGLLYILKKQS